VRWVAEDNPIAARGLRNAIARAAETIGDHSEIGVARPDLAEQPYRFLFLVGFPLRRRV
jgi:toxin ParE1/3/4